MAADKAEASHSLGCNDGYSATFWESEPAEPSYLTLVLDSYGELSALILDGPSNDPLFCSIAEKYPQSHCHKDCKSTDIQLKFPAKTFTYACTEDTMSLYDVDDMREGTISIIQFLKQGRTGTVELRPGELPQRMRGAFSFIPRGGDINTGSCCLGDFIGHRPISDATLKLHQIGKNWRYTLTLTDPNIKRLFEGESQHQMTEQEASYTIDFLKSDFGRNGSVAHSSDTISFNESSGDISKGSVITFTKRDTLQLLSKAVFILGEDELVLEVVGDIGYTPAQEEPTNPKPEAAQETSTQTSLLRA